MLITLETRLEQVKIMEQLRQKIVCGPFIINSHNCYDCFIGKNIHDIMYTQIVYFYKCIHNIGISLKVVIFFLLTTMLRSIFTS